MILSNTAVGYAKALVRGTADASYDAAAGAISVSLRNRRADCARFKNRLPRVIGRSTTLSVRFPNGIAERRSTLTRCAIILSLTGAGSYANTARFCDGGRARPVTSPEPIRYEQMIVMIAKARRT
jgi:hypothetical protein